MAKVPVDQASKLRAKQNKSVSNGSVVKGEQYKVADAGKNKFDLIHLSIGLYYTFGNFSPYLTSYLREVTGSNLRYSTSNWILTTLSISISISSVLVGQFCSKYRPKIVLVILTGCLVMTYGN